MLTNVDDRQRRFIRVRPTSSFRDRANAIHGGEAQPHPLDLRSSKMWINFHSECSKTIFDAELTSFILKLGQFSTRTGIGAPTMGGGDQQVSRFTMNWRSSKLYVSALVPGEALKERGRSDASDRVSKLLTY